MKPIERVHAAFYKEESDRIPVWCSLSSPAGEERYFDNRLNQFKDWKERSLFTTRTYGNDIVFSLDPSIFPVPFPAGGFLEKVIFETNDHIIHESIFKSIQYTRKKPWFSTVLCPQVRWPEDLNHLESPDLEKIKTDAESMAEAVKWYEEKGYPSLLPVLGPFDAAMKYLQGRERFLSNVVVNPVFAKKLVDFVAGALIEISKIFLEEARFFGLFLADDLGTSKTLFISPKAWRQILRPWYKKFIKMAHKASAQVMLHSHGNINPLFEDLVNTGTDCIHPLDPLEGINLAEVKKKYGDKVALAGGVTSVIGKMSKEEINNHVAEVIDVGSLGGGFILSCSMGDEVPKEKVNYIIKTIQKVIT